MRTSVVAIATHLQTPWETPVIVKLLISVVQEAAGGNVDRAENDVASTGTCNDIRMCLVANIFP